MKKTLLWLDDCRNPLDEKVDWMVFSPIGRDVNVVWIQYVDEFVVDYCMKHDLDIPAYNIQSSNPVGKDNIRHLMDNYHRFYEKSHKQ